MNAIQSLQTGETLLHKAIKTADAVNGTGYQLEFAEKVQTGSAGPNLLALFNADDQRFSSGARRCWIKISLLQASALFGINFGDDAAWAINSETGKEELVIDQLNPEVQGKRLRVRVMESTTPFNDYQAANPERAAKRKGKDGDYLFHKGAMIYSNTELVALPVGQEPVHTLLATDAVTAPATSAISDEVGM
jgi:hypothetical protein